MKKIILFFFAFALVFLSGCNQTNNNTIKIGAILPLTGDAAAWGIPPKNGATLAVSGIVGGATGDGNRGYSFRLVLSKKAV